MLQRLAVTNPKNDKMDPHDVIQLYLDTNNLLMFKVLFMYSVYLSLLPDIKDPLKYKTPSNIKLVQVSEKNERNAVHKDD